VKELILKLGFLSNQEKGKEKEIKAVTYSKAKTESKAKETPDSDTISGIAFNNDIKENTLRGCFFTKEE
jgi:hypothetical protein